jgi:YggT family protein
VGLFLTNLLSVGLFALWLLIIGRVLISTTEPILAPVRRVLPQTGMVDFSPLVVLIVLGLLSSVILRPG